MALSGFKVESEQYVKPGRLIDLYRYPNMVNLVVPFGFRQIWYSVSYLVFQREVDLLEQLKANGDGKYCDEI